MKKLTIKQMQEIKGGNPTTGKPITIKDEEIEE
jgi:bacteriocin-like protein